MVSGTRGGLRRPIITAIMSLINGMGSAVKSANELQMNARTVASASFRRRSADFDRRIGVAMDTPEVTYARECSQGQRTSLEDRSYARE